MQGNSIEIEILCWCPDGLSEKKKQNKARKKVLNMKIWRVFFLIIWGDERKSSDIIFSVFGEINILEGSSLHRS